MRYLGLDGGGSKTEAVILEVDGAGAIRRELGRGRGGPCNLGTCSDEVLRASVADAVAEAERRAGLAPGAEFVSACAGIAGFGNPARREVFERLLGELIAAPALSVVPDYVVAYWGASGGAPGVAVIAGTGSIVYGTNAQGAQARAGGRGYLFSDEGSGYWLASQGLRRTLARLDRRERLEDFDHRVCEFAGRELGSEVTEPDELASWIGRDTSPARIARLAAEIGRWAAEEDPVASELLDRGARELAAQASSVLAWLGLDPGAPSTAVYLMGGLWNLAGDYRGRFLRILGATAHEPLHDPAVGAALVAMGLGSKG